MSNRQVVEALSHSAAFANCDKADLEALVDAGELTSFTAGWPFVQQGTPADACYVVLSGAARVFYGRNEVARIGIGDIIGEGGLLTGSQRSATVSASEPTTALRIDYDDLRTLLESRPHLKETLIAVYRARNPE